MKRLFSAGLVVVIISGLVACDQLASDVEYPTPSDILRSEKQRAISPDVDETDLAILADGNSAFAIDLYQALRETDGNLFYSPYSISLAMVMAHAGARGETEEKMADTLRFTLSRDRLHPAFNSLDTELSRRGEGAKGKDEEGFRLNIVNAMWGQKDYDFLLEFLDILAENYDAGLRILDFAEVPEESRITINRWISDQTEERIEDLIPQGLIDTSTRLVLTNAIYFNAAWQYPFEEDETHSGSFNLLDGDEVTIPIMMQTESFEYAEGDGFQAIELPYDGNEISMVILLPETSTFAEFEELLDAQQIEEIIGSLGHSRIALSMPKFEYESGFSLKEALALMGMSVAFSGEADFSGMTGNRELFITDVVHKALVSLDEAGTEAAAATAVIVALTGMPETPVKVTIDRPFIFLIRDIETRTILFMGRVLDPSK